MRHGSSIPLVDLVLVGGGHAHAVVIKKLAMNPLPGLRVLLISSRSDTPYSGMLPGFIAGHFSFEECHIDLRKLSEYAGIQFIQSQVNHLNLKEKKLICEGRPDILFDFISINIGSTPETSDLFSPYILAVKPIERFLPGLEQLLLLQQGHICIVGCGASGIELILAIQYRLQKIHFLNNHRYTLICADSEILPQHNQKVRSTMIKILKERGIDVIVNARVTDITMDETHDNKLIHYQDSTHTTKPGIKTIAADQVIWATHAAAAKWLQNSGLDLDERGFIKVNDYLQSTSHDFVFAAGDIASMINFQRPKSGVYAVRQGLPLFKNIVNYASKKSLTVYKPQRYFLSLLNCGNRFAIASRSFMALSGRWLWNYKRWIDTRFMKQFQQLPDMHQIEQRYHQQLSREYGTIASEQTIKKMAGIPMHCGGCAAKISPALLNRVINEIIRDYSSSSDNNLILSLSDKDDAVAFNVPEDKTLIQSIDYFRSFINDPFLFGRIAVNHAIGDIYAMGARPHSALALISMPYMPHNQQYNTLFQLMSGIIKQCQHEHLILSGGHTGEAQELACGMTINGLVNQKQYLTKARLVENQQLILTKPLGTGVLLAANMRYKAKGEWMEQGIKSMLLSHSPLLDIFMNYPIKACTDITGFGLAGHLYEMLKASDKSARLQLHKLPLLTGTLECMRQGVYSSLYQENLYFQQFIQIDEKLSDHCRSIMPILFDPQTAGGLLLAVDSQQSSDLIGELHQAGLVDSTIIGTVCTHKNGQKPEILLN